MCSMKISKKDLSETRVEITVTLDEKDWQKSEERAVERLAKDVKLQGFRKGKAPVEMARDHIDPRQLTEVTVDLAVRNAVPAAYIEAKVQPFNIDKVEVTKIVNGESIEFTTTADILPEIKLGDYKKLKAKREDVKVAKKDIDEVIANVRKAYAEKKVAKKKAEKGDEVVIDFEGTKDGEKFQGGTAKDYHLELGSNTFIPGFEDGCVGHESGDRFDIKLTFPKDYHEKSLAGQKVNFNVLVKQVNEVVEPALDDEFAKKCGPFKTMDELRADIKKNLEAQNKVKADDKLKDDLVNELIEKSKVAAPGILVEDQIRMIKNDITANARSQGLTFEDYLTQTKQTEEDWKKSVTPLAESRVKASLILQVLAHDENITVSEDIVDAKVNELKEVYKKSKEALGQLKQPQVRQDIKNRLTIEKTLNQLVEWNSK